MPINPEEYGPKSERYGPKSERMLLFDDVEAGILTDAIGHRDQPPSRSGSLIQILKKQGQQGEVQMARLPTWGLSDLREIVETNGTAAVVDEALGLVQVQSGTDANGSASLRTVERGRYRPGAKAEVGVGILFTALPTGNQEARWGYFDDQNGFGFGLDADGLFLFRRTGGVDTTIRQEDFNNDTLSGEGGADNPSFIELDPLDGAIWNIGFRWYGFGRVDWTVDVTKADEDRKVQTVLHREVYPGGLSIVDPNQPITVEVSNNGTAGNFICFVGGRQFSTDRTGTANQGRRSIPERITGYELTVAEGVWEPLIAVRKKATHGPSGRTNSVHAVLAGFAATLDENAEIRLTYNGTITGGTWSTPTGWTDAESALETKVQGETTFSASGGLTVASKYNPAANSGPRSRRQFTRSPVDIVVGQERPVTLWARPLTATTTTVEYASIDLVEDW